jgi:hypothetical protein
MDVAKNALMKGWQNLKLKMKKPPRVRRVTHSSWMIEFKGGVAHWFNLPLQGISRINIWEQCYTSQGEYVGANIHMTIPMDSDYDHERFIDTVVEKLGGVLRIGD